MHIVVASLGFPWWLRLEHYLNLLFIGLLIRSGIQIVAAHPRFYWHNNSNPKKKEWLKFTTKKVPEDKLYTSMDDEEPVSPLLALPGKDNLGLGRHWHFFSIIFWVLNGVIYVVLLFATGEWIRSYYEVIDMQLAQHPQTILAYEMDGMPLPIEHSVPLRLRVETVLGYKMVKYLRSIEFVAEYTAPSTRDRAAFARIINSMAEARRFNHGRAAKVSSLSCP